MRFRRIRTRWFYLAWRFDRNSSWWSVAHVGPTRGSIRSHWLLIGPLQLEVHVVLNGPAT